MSQRRNQSGGFYRGGGRGGRDGGGDHGSRQVDWRCLSCNNNNFAWRTQCNRCQDPKPDCGGSPNDGGGHSESFDSSRGGPVVDWRCPNFSCNYSNFAWRTQCNRCQAPKPDAGGSDQ